MIRIKSTTTHSLRLIHSKNIRSLSFKSSDSIQKPLYDINSPKIRDNKELEDDGYLREDDSFFRRIIKKFRKPPNPGTLILVRHGESEWNHRDLFTGWVDVDLSERGVREIEHAARLLMESGYNVDITYTSMLKRAIRSSWIILSEINQIYRPIIKTWRLNERMYGSLEGHSKPGLAKLYGEELVQTWRKSIKERPPVMTSDHVYWHGRESKYSFLPSSLIPRTESLSDTMDRTVPFWNSHIKPDLLSGRTVMIVAHRNSIRSLINYIEGFSSVNVGSINIPNAIPLVYKFDKNMNPIKLDGAVEPLSGTFLEKHDQLRAAMVREEYYSNNITPISSSYSSSFRGIYDSKSSLSLPDYVPNKSKITRVNRNELVVTSDQSNMVRSLAKLENQRKILEILDNKYKDTDKNKKKKVPVLDNEKYADIFIDPQILNSAAYKTSTSPQNDPTDTFNSDQKAIEEYEQTNDLKSSTSEPLDIKKLNQIHYFSKPTNSTTKFIPHQILSDYCEIKPIRQGENGEYEIIHSNHDESSEETKKLIEKEKEKIDHNRNILSSPLLVIVRHGKTDHNQLGLFTGWEDVSLANKGREEAIAAGKLLRRHNIEFDIIYTSWLSRAIETAWLIMNEMDCLWLPIVKTWRLNERMYGNLTGLSKKMIKQIYGNAQFQQWRRGYDIQPPNVSPFSPIYPGNDQRYVNYVTDIPINFFETITRSLAHGKLEIHRDFPKAESLKDCMDRTIPYFQNTIVPDALNKGKNVLIASSENAIRGLLMHLCDIPTNKIPLVEIPTGLPIVYDPIKRRILLFQDGEIGESKNPLEKYNFGSAPELLFKYEKTIDGKLNDNYWKDIIVKDLKYYH